jgi:hypothetical protein
VIPRAEDMCYGALHGVIANPSFSSEHVSHCVSTTGLSVALQSRYRFSSVLRVGKAHFQSIPSNA